MSRMMIAAGTVDIRHNGITTTIPAQNAHGSHRALLNNIAKPVPGGLLPIRAGSGLMGLEVVWEFGDLIDTIIVTDKLTETEVLYRITQAEAGGENMKGRILVTNVIMNRVRSTLRDFANVNTVKDVVFQAGQFEPIRNGAFERAAVTLSTKEAVHMALDGKDYSRGALWFRTIRGAKGSWHERALTALFDHGGHRFYGI